MLNKAYELGIKLAVEEEGITKEAFGKALASGLTKLMKTPTMGKVLQWGANNPMLATTGLGAGIGGLGGALFGDEGGAMRGALMGAGIGAGAGLGMGTHGRKALGLLQKGGAGQLSPAAMKRLGAAGATLQRRALPMLGGAAAGGIGAGMLGSSLVPNPENQPWYRRMM